MFLWAPQPLWLGCFLVYTHCVKRDKQQLQTILQGSINDTDNNCEGALGNPGNYYVMGVKFGIGVAKYPYLSNEGSKKLDQINAFDLAEVENANLGQINAIRVSSFCGSKGLLWGYDVCRNNIQEHPDSAAIRAKREDIGDVPILDMARLEEAFLGLVGTVSEPVHPILPGSMVSAAMKETYAEGETVIYSCLSIGIPKDDTVAAKLLMEDVGTMPVDYTDDHVHTIQANSVVSVLEIGRNQQVEYEAIFTGIHYRKVEKDEVGCALVACPYLTLPRAAAPLEQDLTELTFQDWQDLK